MSLASARKTFGMHASAVAKSLGIVRGSRRHSRSRPRSTDLRLEGLEPRIALTLLLSGTTTVSSGTLTVYPGTLPSGTVQGGTIQLPGTGSLSVTSPSPQPPIVVESSGSVTLTSTYDNSGVQYYANDELITLNGSPFKRTGDWQALAADVVTGVNTVVLRHSSGHIHFWRLDNEWRHVSGDGWIAPGTAAFYNTEVAFGADLDFDAVVTIEAVGEVTLAYSKLSGNILRANGIGVWFNGAFADYQELTLNGWTPVAAEVDQGVNTIVLRHSSGTIHFWRFDSNWIHVGGDGWVAPGTTDFFSAEVLFGSDLDGDGGLTIENAGSVVLDYAPDGNIRANGTPVMFNGNSMNYFSMVAAGWTPTAADVDNGVNTIVLKSSSGYLHFWRMDASWNQVGGDGWTRIDTRAFFAAERAFGADLDGDGFRTIEANGYFLLVYDRVGRLSIPTKFSLVDGSTVVDVFRTSYGTFITYNDTPYNYFGGIEAGWIVMAADIHANHNTVLLKHAASGYLHFWRRDSWWQQIGGDGWVAPGSPTYFATEVAFGVDLDDNGAIGS